MSQYLVVRKKKSRSSETLDVENETKDDCHHDNFGVGFLSIVSVRQHNLYILLAP